MPHLIVSGLLKRTFYKTLNENGGKPLTPNSNRQSRRKFLHDAAIMGAGMALAPSLLSANYFSNDEKIIVAGAGIAGLNAAYQLKRSGLKAPVYDAAHLTGGRMYTMKKENK